MQTPLPREETVDIVKTPPNWLTWTIIAATLLAVFSMPYGYYQLLRLLVTGYAGYMACIYYQQRTGLWAWALAFVALIYNPVFIITMSKSFHGVVNVLTAGFFVFEFYRLRALLPNSRGHAVDRS